MLLPYVHLDIQKLHFFGLDLKIVNDQKSNKQIKKCWFCPVIHIWKDQTYDAVIESIALGPNVISSSGLVPPNLLGS